ncbi:MAG TPA: metalloregulator ArsR/SmtB family transcription factor [Candidatus Cybelea sp.]|nr:metalloregulator ArsR/SmtB family transcription factor [Candidatus Cybelea sp.]
MNAKHAVAALSAIAHDHRLAIYRLLVERGPEGIPAGDIAGRLDMPPSSLTFHLQQMRHAGLITQRRLGRQLIYAADFAAMNGLVSYLTENCCGRGADAACAAACNPAAAIAGRGRKQRRTA